MAAIDKTYTKSWEEYKQAIEWAENTVFECPNGQIIRPINYCYGGAEEKDFDGTQEFVIMNSSYELDYFLIKYCPLKVIQDRMKEVYSEEYYDSIKNGTSEFDTFTKEGKISTRVKVVKRCRSKKTTYKWRGHKEMYWIWVDHPTIKCWYSEEYNHWIWYGELGVWESNVAKKCRSLKAAIRHIRKWQLPKGATVTVQSNDGIWEFMCK